MGAFSSRVDLEDKPPPVVNTPAMPDDNTSLAEPFPLLKLPLELQEMVWEMTDPEPQFIEIIPRVSSYQPATLRRGGSRSGQYIDDDIYDVDSDPEKPNDYLGLRLAGSLKRLKYEFACPGAQSTRAYRGPSSRPVALHVCRASRAQALLRYVAVIDSTNDRNSFFFDPRRDVLSLCRSRIYKGKTTAAKLKRRFGAPIDLIENIIVAEQHWTNCREQGETRAFYREDLSMFPELKVVTVLLQRWQYDGRYNMVLVDPKEFPGRAREMAERDKKWLGQHDWKLEYVDRFGHVYEQLTPTGAGC